MTGIIDSVESEVVQMLVLTVIFINGVVLLVEFILTSPRNVFSQSFTTSPIADEILITVIDEDSQATVDKGSQSSSEIGDPISTEFSVDGVVALRPGSARDSEGSLNSGLFKEVINEAQVVAEGLVFTGFSDIVDVELRGVAQNSFNLSLALDQSEGVEALLDEGVAELEASNQTLVELFIDEVVFQSVVSVLGVLPVDAHKTITDGDTVELEVKTSLLNDIVGDGGDVVSGIRFTSDVEVSALELGERFKEFLKEKIEISSDFIFSLVELSTSGETSTEGLIDVEEVSVVIPGVRVDSKGVVFLVNIVRTVFNKESKFTGAAGTTSKPDNKRISVLVTSGFEKPEEQRALLLDGLETSIVTFVQEEGVGVFNVVVAKSEIAVFIDFAGDEGKEGNSEEDCGKSGHKYLNL